MIIFANKHVSGTRGKALTFLLRIAIFIRAVLAIFQSFLSGLFLPFIDVLLMFSNLYFLHLLWENVIKKSEQVVFPATFFYFNIPIYILVWMFSMWLVGVYEKNTKWLRLLAGLSIGTIMIATLYAFFPNFLRTSRGVIVGAFILNVLLLTAYRFLICFAKGTLRSYITDVRKYIIIAGEQEAGDLAMQLEKSGQKRKYIGFISLHNGLKHPKNLGGIENLTDIVDAYKPNELLFSTEEVSTQFIIESMSKIKEPVAFRLVSKNNTIISSTSKNKTGEIYSLDVNLSAGKTWLDKLRSWI